MDELELVEVWPVGVAWVLLHFFATLVFQVLPFLSTVHAWKVGRVGTGELSVICDVIHYIILPTNLNTPEVQGLV